jgi:hypothetical protein
MQPWTPLMHAARSGMLPYILTFVRAHHCVRRRAASPAPADREQLHKALSRDLTVTYRGGATLLQQAVWSGQLAAVATLLSLPRSAVSVPPPPPPPPGELFGWPLPLLFMPSPPGLRLQPAPAPTHVKGQQCASAAQLHAWCACRLAALAVRRCERARPLQRKGGHRLLWRGAVRDARGRCSRARMREAPWR